MPEVRLSYTKDGISNAGNPVAIVSATMLLPQVASLYTQAGNAVGDMFATKAGKGANADITFLSGASGAGIDFLSSSTTVASAATVDLGALTTRRVQITGTATISSFGTQPHRERLIHFAGACTLTHSANLMLPGGVNRTVAAGDRARATSDASGAWSVLVWGRADGKSYTPPAAVDVTGTSASGQAVLTGTATQGAAALGLNAAAPAFRNRIINGNFSINQLVVSGTVTLAANAYGHDGWKAGSGGCTYTFAAAANGDVVVTITAGTLLQVVEGPLYVPEGGAYTLSWTGTATARMWQGSASGSYAASPVTKTGNTAGSNLVVEFGLGTVSLAQLEPGAASTVFERRDDELRRCQRYFCKTYRLGIAPGSATFIASIRGILNGSGNRAGIAWPFPAIMAYIPTVIVYGISTGSSGKVLDEDGNTEIAATIYGANERGISSMDASGSASRSILAHFTASARM